MSLMISFTKILSSKNTCCRYRAKNGQIIYKDQLIDNRNSGHLLRSKLSYHNIIQKADQICDCILNDHRNGKQQISFIKFPVSYILLFKFIHS